MDRGFDRSGRLCAKTLSNERGSMPRIIIDSGEMSPDDRLWGSRMVIPYQHAILEGSFRFGEEKRGLTRICVRPGFVSFS